MDTLRQHVATLLARRPLPVPALATLLSELRREGRALTPGALLRVLTTDRGRLRVLRPWRGRLAPLSPEAGDGGRVRERPRRPFRRAVPRRRLRLSTGAAAARSTPRAPRPVPEGAILVAGPLPLSADRDIAPPSFARVARSVVKLAQDLDADSLLDRARWLQLEVEARTLSV